jgi:hypothetical protein
VERREKGVSGSPDWTESLEPCVWIKSDDAELVPEELAPEDAAVATAC